MVRTIDLKSYKNVVATGDIHGNFRSAVSSIVGQYRLEDTLILVCGDIGMGFLKKNYYKEEFSWMQRRIEKNNCALAMFRGNHDNPQYFDDLDFSMFWHGGDYPNVFLVQDNTVLETSAGNILCCGGAVSIDRTARTENVTWWKGEKFVQPTEEDFAELDRMKIDAVATHTCPACCGPVFSDAMGYEKYDKQLMVELWNERKDLEDLYDRLRETHTISLWVYGHFHNHYSEDHGVIRFVGLDMLRQKGLDVFSM